MLVRTFDFQKREVSALIDFMWWVMGIRYILLFSHKNKSGELFMPDIFKAAAAPIKEQEP